MKIIYLTCFENCLKLKKITFDSNDTKIVLNRNFCNQYPIIYLKSLEFLTFSSINSLNIDKSKRNPLYSGSNLYSSIFNNFDGETQKSIFFLLLQMETNKLSYKGYPNDSQIYVVFLLLQNISEKLNENLNNDFNYISISWKDILINHKAMDIIIDVAYFDNDSDSEKEKEKEEFDEDSDSYLDDVSIDITNILPLNYNYKKDSFLNLFIVFEYPSKFNKDLYDILVEKSIKYHFCMGIFITGISTTNQCFRNDRYIKYVKFDNTVKKNRRKVI